MKNCKKLLALFMATLMVFSMFSGFDLTAFAWGFEEDELDVESLTVEPTVIIQNNDGYWDTKWDWGNWNETEYFCYYLDDLDFTVTLKDGTVLESESGYVEYNGTAYLLDTYSYQNENPLTLGENEVTVYLSGYETTVTVEVVETPVANVEVEPVEIIEHNDGYWDTRYDDNENGVEYFCYNLPDFDFTVTFKDGTVIESESGYIDYNGDECYLYDNLDQYANPLTLGNHEIPVSILGFDATATVEVVETPVANVEVEPVEIIENCDGYWETKYDDNWNEVEYFCYNLPDFNFTVTLKDGTVIESEYGYIDYNGEECYLYNNLDQYETPLTLGKHEIPVSILGYDTTAIVEIIGADSEEIVFEYSNVDDGVVITGVNDISAETLEIPDTINGLPVIGISYLETPYVTAIVIPDSVKFLSSGWLYGCDSVSAITLGSGVEEIGVDILEYAPIAEINVSADNPNFKSVDGVLYSKDGKTLIIYPLAKGDTYTVPATVTDFNVLFTNYIYSDVNIVVSDGSADFVTVDGVTYNADKTQIIYCNPSKTGSYVMPDTVKTISEGAFAGSEIESVSISKNVNEIVYATFADCTSLKSVTIPDSVKSIGRESFANCSSLTEITIPDSVTDIGKKSFSYCSSLKNVNMGNSVSNIEYASFYDCNSLETVTLSNTLKVIGDYAFRNCESLKTIELPSGLEYIGCSVFENTGLTSVVIPDSVTQMGNYVFYYCENLKSVKISSGLTELPSCCFSGCSSLASITIPDSIEYIPSNAFSNTAYVANDANYKDGVLYLGKVLYATNDDVPETVTVAAGTVSISEFAFRSNETIKEIVLPESLKNIGDSAFENCTNISNVALPDGLEVIGYEAFTNTAIKTVKIPDTVTQIVYRSFYSTEVTEIDMPDTLVSMDEDTFDATPWYNAQPDGLIYLGTSLYDYKGEIDSPQSITVADGTLAIAGGAFDGEMNLTGITLPKGLVEIGPAAFYRTGLKSVTIPSTVKYIGEKAFSNSALETIELGNGVKTIGAEAFWGCYNLKSVTIPPSVKEIGDYAFFYYTDSFVIYGATGSVAEAYAKDYGIEFVAIEFTPSELVVPENSDITVTDSVVNLTPEMSVSAFIESVENEKVLVLSTDGTELAADALVGTGSKIQVLDNDGNVLSEYEVMVKSDVDSDGKISPADARLALRASAGLDIIEGVYETAANYDDEDTVSTADARMILRKSVGLE